MKKSECYRIANILKEYTNKNKIMASTVILEEYAKELAEKGCVIIEVKKDENN